MDYYKQFIFDTEKWLYAKRVPEVWYLSVNYDGSLFVYTHGFTYPQPQGVVGNCLSWEFQLEGSLLVNTKYNLYVIEKNTEQLRTKKGTRVMIKSLSALVNALKDYLKWRATWMDCSTQI